MPIKKKFAIMNCMSSSVERLLKLAAETENTPELRKFWEKKYAEVLHTRRLFVVSNKTLELLYQDKTQTRPATTYGDILLCEHLDNQKVLNENLLQDTIETATRFLDALLDKIPFSSEAFAVVAQYRKIAIGIADFDDFLKLNKHINELDIVNYIGSFISNKAYRASESLAEEKGPCLAWEKIKKHLRPKSFEFWYNKNTGEIKNGADICEIFDQNTILQSPFELIPRRNSSILLFPQNQPWQIWSDRDQYSPPTSIDTTQFTSSQDDNHPIITKIDPPKLDEPIFQIGELVRVTIDGQSKILQVIDIDIQPEKKQTFYRLTDGNKETEEKLWNENELSVVELSDLLATINQQEKSTTEPKSQIILNALIIDFSKNLIAIDRQFEGVIKLPSISFEENKESEEVLQTFLNEYFDFYGNITSSLVSATEIKDTKESILHLGFLIDSKYFANSNKVKWVALDSKELPQYIQTLIQKASSQNSLISELQNALRQAIQKQQELESKLPPENYQITSNTTHRQYKPEILATTLGSLSKYVLKLEQLLKTNDYGDMLLTITYDAGGPRIVSLKGRDLPPDLQDTLDLFLELINFILINNIEPRFLSEKLEYAKYEHINLPIKAILQFIGGSLKAAPSRVQEIRPEIVEQIDENNLHKIQNHDILNSVLK